MAPASLLHSCKTRLGRNGAAEVRAHAFFIGINFNQLQKQAAPFRPGLQADDDTSYFPVKRLQRKELAAQRQELKAQRKERNAKRRAAMAAYVQEFDPVFYACCQDALNQLQPGEGPADDAVLDVALEVAAAVVVAAAELEEDEPKIDEDEDEGWAPGMVLPFIGYEFKRFDETFL
ncbi:hypothetical protein C8A01DRAFT_32860 [Parachaetomium inaequale]|uniref:AGC-kinase C-terminal domain-containing protein n=1 Tax=Parachaetomium inaequale TaxID=2588326 RepID=A0AAN6SU06_9PEZI|nr:hypothetical protein C8A01DRAFT_32860 [Parachaetomium inaequale]